MFDLNFLWKYILNKCFGRCVTERVSQMFPMELSNLFSGFKYPTLSDEVSRTLIDENSNEHCEDKF